MPEENDHSDATTDWLANCYQCYGFGHTKEQALEAMAENFDKTDEPVKVVLVEHYGNATVWMGGGYRVDEFVDGEIIEIPAERINALAEAARNVINPRSRALGEAETVEDLSDG